MSTNDNADHLAESLAEGEVSSQFVNEYDQWLTGLAQQGGDVQKFVSEKLPDSGQFMMLDDQDLVHNFRLAAESAPSDIQDDVFGWYERIKEAAGIHDDPGEGPIGRDETPAQEVPGLESIDESLYGHNVRRVPNAQNIDEFILDVERAGIEWDLNSENFQKLWKRAFGHSMITPKNVADWLKLAKTTDSTLRSKLVDLTLGQTTVTDPRGGTSVATGRPSYRRTPEEVADGMMWDWDTNEWINPNTGQILSTGGSSVVPPVVGGAPIRQPPQQQAQPAAQASRQPLTASGTPWASLLLNSGNPCIIHHASGRQIRADVVGDCGQYYRVGIGRATPGRMVGMDPGHGRIPGWTNWYHPRYQDKNFYTYRHGRTATCHYNRVMSINKVNVVQIVDANTGRKIV